MFTKFSAVKTIQWEFKLFILSSTVLIYSFKSIKEKYTFWLVCKIQDFWDNRVLWKLPKLFSITRFDILQKFENYDFS